MTDQQGETEYLAFLDECGDHSLTKIDRDFPIFVLSLLLIRRADYRDVILPAINALKLRYWDHEGVNLHSRDIRKASGPFAILQHPARRQSFMEDLAGLMRDLPYEVFIVGIHKQKLRDRYVRAENPYELALTFVMERLLYCLEQRAQTTLTIIAEARGTNEDNALKAAFFDLISNGTQYVGKSRFEKRSFRLKFHDKRKNIVGIQLADLCAHPAARHMLKPDQPNQAYEIVNGHLYQGNGKVSGWKKFP